MFSLIGLGLDKKGYSAEARDLISNADKIYFENYTVNYPYNRGDLEKQFKGKKFIEADRNLVESMEFLDEAKKRNVVLLVYGSPLMATTHISLIEEAKKRKIKYSIVHGASIFDAISETGLQVYKFGKTASVPKHEASSFLEIVKDNKKIGAHSLILIDIGLELNDVLKKLNKISGKIVLCQSIGTKDSKIFYGEIDKLKNKKPKKPYCLIIPGKLHFLERDFLKGFKL